MNQEKEKELLISAIYRHWLHLTDMQFEFAMQIKLLLTTARLDYCILKKHKSRFQRILEYFKNTDI